MQIASANFEWDVIVPVSLASEASRLKRPPHYHLLGVDLCLRLEGNCIPIAAVTNHVPDALLRKWVIWLSSGLALIGVAVCCHLVLEVISSEPVSLWSSRLAQRAVITPVLQSRMSITHDD